MGWEADLLPRRDGGYKENTIGQVYLRGRQKKEQVTSRHSGEDGLHHLLELHSVARCRSD